MNFPIKISFSFLAIVLLFKLGFDKASSQNTRVAPPSKKSRSNSYQISNFSPSRLLPRQSRFSINGMPAEVDLYASRKPFEQQITQLENDWRAKGYKTSAQTVGNMKILSAFDERASQFECAIMIPDPASRQTYVIPARLDLRRPPQQNNFKTPIYPNAQTLFHIESHDLAGASENIIQVSDAGVAAVMSYYKSQFLWQGWQLLQTPKSLYHPQYADQALLVKGLNERWIYAGKMDGQNRTLIFSLLNEKP